MIEENTRPVTSHILRKIELHEFKILTLFNPMCPHFFRRLIIHFASALKLHSKAPHYYLNEIRLAFRSRHVSCDQRRGSFLGTCMSTNSVLCMYCLQ